MEDTEKTPDTPEAERPLTSSIPGPETTLREMLTDRRAWIDGTIAPLLFLAVNAYAGLVAAAIVAVGWAVGVALYRLVRRQKVSYALGGMFGLAVAVGLALITGRASTYFLPNAVIGAIYGLIGLGSVVLKRPISAAIARFVDQKPREWYALPRVRNTHIAITSVWSVFFIMRSAIRYYLISIDSEWGLAVTTVALGLPATGLLFAGTWAFVRRRLAGLQVIRSATEPSS